MAVVHRHAERHSSDETLLLDAATKANEKAVRFFIQSGTDINALDAVGRSIVACALAGDRWMDTDVSDASYMLPKRLQILKLLLNHEHISLRTLNAPQSAMRGITPLAYAAWQNNTQAVKLLLGERPGLVFVDGMDATGATPLMYAARDCSLEVVQHLLVNNARPDYRDVNHRTAIQHSLRHLPVLYACEAGLRLHRARENLTKPDKRRLCPPPHPDFDKYIASTSYRRFQHVTSLVFYKEDAAKTTTAILNAIFSTDLPALHSLLFPDFSSPLATAHLSPCFVNLPDSNGWSSIHHCVTVEHPSIQVLDMLYRAGADVSLFTASGLTVLHCLAIRARPAANPALKTSKQVFVRHLVLDLRAPLSARNNNGDTCLHAAAEHGESVDVLEALLSCDLNGAVREMRNSRGLTAQEVAKPQFRAVFGLATEPSRPVSSASVRTIRPTVSLKSISSLTSLAVSGPRTPRVTDHNVSAEDINIEISSMAQRILNNLRHISQEEGLSVDAAGVLLRETCVMGVRLFAEFRAQLYEAAEDLRDARGKFKRADTLVGLISSEIEYQLQLPQTSSFGQGVPRRRRLTIESNDSGSTAVSDTSLQTPLASEPVIARTYNPPDATTLRQLADLTQIDTSSHASFSEDDSANSPSEDEKGLRKLVSPWIKDIPRRRSKGNIRAKTLDDLHASEFPEEAERKDTSVTGTLKAWWKKVIKPESPVKADAPRPVDEQKDSVKDGQETTNEGWFSLVTAPHIYFENNNMPGSSSPSVPSNRQKLEAPRRVITVVSYDLSRLDACMESADQLIVLANHSISQAEKILERAISNRRSLLQRARVASGSNPSIGHSSNQTNAETISPRPRDSAIYLTAPSSESFSKTRPRTLSTNSSCSSLSSTLIEGDDDDTRALRRLLTRKIEARTTGALDEIDKVMLWLSLVRDAIINARRQML